MSRWFRHYAGMMRDDKLVGAAIRSKQPVERVVWIWGAILESASEINDDGIYRLDCAEVAYFLRADEADIRAVLDALADAGRVGGDRVVKWSDRQFKSDQSAERQARYRDRRKAEVRDGDDQPSGSDGRVTSLSQPSDAPETDTDTELEAETERDKPRASVQDPARAVFDELWELFPRNPTSNEGRAEAAFRATKAKDHPLILAAAQRRRLFFLEDCEARHRTEDEGLKYEPHLATWISTGDWKTPLVLKSDVGKPDPDYAVVDAASDDFKALQRFRGPERPINVGNSGKITVRRVELEQARTAA